LTTLVTGPISVEEMFAVEVRGTRGTEGGETAEQRVRAESPTQARLPLLSVARLTAVTKLLPASERENRKLCGTSSKSHVFRSMTIKLG